SELFSKKIHRDLELVLPILPTILPIAPIVSKKMCRYFWSLTCGYENTAFQAEKKILLNSYIHFYLFCLIRTTLTKIPSVLICIGKKSNKIKTYESINSIIKDWNIGLFLIFGWILFPKIKRKISKNEQDVRIA
ncbi:MAG: hypothetical protein LBK82_00455, partial [Planctomycetaceae bacterium]|nr:hypothetical protein [Planctomycetaceae bacterium]